MKGYRFYNVVENKGKAKEKPHQECIAVYYKNSWTSWCGDHHDTIYECAAPIFAKPNSPCGGSQVAQQYLSEHTRRVSEKRAHELHPTLFEYLEG